MMNGTTGTFGQAGYYRRPSPLRARVVDPVVRWLVLRCGLGRRGDQDVLRVLRVRGRRSGRPHDVPVRIAAWEGQRYILSMLGESQWVRNLRAVGMAELLVGEATESVRARELETDDKAAFFAWYCRVYELRARFGLQADPRQLTPAELDRLAHRYPVFRLEAE
jgi:deazaflavin-dependent oxidoreductase (nitroreductase family)